MLAGSLHKAPHVHPGPGPSDKLSEICLFHLSQVIFTLPKCREKKIKKKEKNISSSEGRTTSETALGTSGAARLENCFVTSSKQIHLSLSKAPLLPHGDNSTPEATKRNSKIPVKDIQLMRQLQKIHSASEGISHTQHLEPGSTWVSLNWQCWLAASTPLIPSDC